MGKAPAHPKFIDMIEAAIAALKERGGSSRQAIAKFIKANYKVGDSADTHIRLALRRAAGKSLIQVKGTGASGSFKVAPKPKPAKKKVKKAKKPVKKAKKPKKKTAKKAKKPAKKTAKKSAKKAKKPAAKKAKKTAAKKPAAKKSVKAKKPAAKKSAKKPAAKKAARKSP